MCYRWNSLKNQHPSKRYCKDRRAYMGYKAHKDCKASRASFAVIHNAKEHPDSFFDNGADYNRHR